MQLAKDVLTLAVVGVVFALIANAVSPRGIALRRDYFYAAAPATPAAKSAATPTIANPPAPAATAAQPTHTTRGLPLVAHAEVAKLFADPRFAEGRIMFVDARDDAHYQAGHIPGAYAFDHYHPERSIADVLAPAAIAERIVVYCTGGTCEDSELATLDLIAFGMPREKFVIYAGGITEWKQRGLPVETGRRGSGKR